MWLHFTHIKMKLAVFVCLYTLKASMSMDMSHLTDTRGIMRIFENPFKKIIQPPFLPLTFFI